MADGPNPVAGGSGANNANVAPNVAQNIIVNPAAQNAAAKLAQQILANTNVTLKQEIVKILEFFGEKGKDTVMAQEFINDCFKRLERHNNVCEFPALSEGRS
jgi:hypothetical protein